MKLLLQPGVKRGYGIPAIMLKSVAFYIHMEKMHKNKAKCRKTCNCIFLMNLPKKGLYYKL